MTQTHATHALPSAADLRLVVSDMDGTFLDGAGAPPPGWADLAAELARRGVAFAPASGRQHAAIVGVLEPGADTVVIAENGAHVRRGDELVAAAPLPRGRADAALAAVRAMPAPGHDVGAVLCGVRSAYVERDDEAFLEHVERYFRALEIVDDLGDVDDEIVKVSVLDLRAPDSDVAERLAAALPDLTVRSGSRHWIDVQRPDVDKGTAVRALQERLGIGPEQTLVFGDYLNDLPMFEAAAHTVAMANAHADVLARARHVAPSNDEDGVVRTLRAILG